MDGKVFLAKYNLKTPPPASLNQIFDIFAYSEKTQKKKIFDINLSVIGPLRALGRVKMLKSQI